MSVHLNSTASADRSRGADPADLLLGSLVMATEIRYHERGVFRSRCPRCRAALEVRLDEAGWASMECQKGCPPKAILEELELDENLRPTGGWAASPLHVALGRLMRLGLAPRETEDITIWRALCPICHRVLTIQELDSGRVTLRCESNCRTDQVLARLGLQLDDLVPPEYRLAVKQEPEVKPASSLFVTSTSLLAEAQSTAWWWAGYVPAGGVVLCSGRPKSGKSTLLFHMIRALLAGEGSFLGQRVSFPGEAKVAVLIEENEALVADRLRALGIGTDRLLLAFRCRCQGRPLVDVVREALELGAALVAVDTLAAWAGIEDENAASEVESTLRPVIIACQERHAALLLLHHLRKSDGPEGTAHRGSGHLAAVADVLLELRRPEGNAPPTRRVLRALSRYVETSSELVIELRPDGYRALGSGEEVQHRRALEALLDRLPGPGEEPIPFEIRAKNGEEPPDTIMGRLSGLGLGRSTVQRALRELLAQGRVERIGGGRKGDPARYRLLFAQNSMPPILKELELGGIEFENVGFVSAQLPPL